MQTCTTSPQRLFLIHTTYYTIIRADSCFQNNKLLQGDGKGMGGGHQRWDTCGSEPLHCKGSYPQLYRLPMTLPQLIRCIGVRGPASHPAPNTHAKSAVHHMHWVPWGTPHGQLISRKGEKNPALL